MTAKKAVAKETPPVELLTLRGKVEVIHYNDGKFAAGRIRSSDGTLISFSGPVYVAPEEIVVWKGYYERHPKYGWQFKISDPIYEQTLDAEGLAHYLANDPKMKGLGPVKAQKIAQTFGTEFDRIINEEPERVERLVGLSSMAVANIRDEWNARRELHMALTKLSKYGLTHHQVTLLTKKFGNESVKIIENNPYLITSVVSELGFKRTDEIARKVGIPKASDCRLKAGVIHCLQLQLEAGHCWIELPELVDLANRELIIDDLNSKRMIEETIETLTTEGKLACVNIEDRILVALPAMYKMECDLATWFSSGRRFNPHFVQEKDLESQIVKRWPTLNEKQKEAMLMALRFRQTLISGPAGSGKTYVTKAICDFYENRGRKIQLCSPTGKAAKRLSEVSGRKATTIHRMIGIKPGEDRKNPKPVDADLIIVDEISMLGIELAWMLFKSVDLERTCLIFLGDHNQLPSVDPGNILRDLINQKFTPTVILKDVVRQAGVLRENSLKILQGKVEERTDVVNPTGRKPWYVMQTGEAEETRSYIEALYSKTDREGSDVLTRLSFHLIKDVQLLSARKAGILGTEQLNLTLQKIIQKKLYGVEINDLKPTFHLYDRVIQTMNDHELDVMNGEIGVITGITKKELQIEFGDREVKIPRGTAKERQLQLAYCLTIHKFQGSEWPCVISVIHKSHSFGHDRNLLYTAVTRARETAIIVGDRWGIQNCAKITKSINRRTFLSLLPPKTNQDLF
jgi:exodeoxyribonuclease V alpha subunit